MPLVIVQACRSWTSTTPGTPARWSRTSSRSRPFGAISSSTTTESFSRSSDRGRISTAITSEAIGSARWKPVSAITTPAATASTDPSRSASTSVAAPRRLRLPVSDRFRIASETALATRPTSANPISGPASTVVRVGQPGDAGVRQVAADHQQRPGRSASRRGSRPGAAERRARPGRAGWRRTTPRARARSRRRRWPCGRRPRAARASRRPRHRPARPPSPSR